jgi:mRNA interferase MazF
MVKQGDIIKVDFSPTAGHEQSGYRPAVVVSNNFAVMKSKLVYAAPITNTLRNYPLHIELDSRTKTTGVILCEQVKAIDIEARSIIFVERLPDDILKKVISFITACLDF